MNPLISPNTTCDIYRMGNSPPAAPDVAGVPIHLRPDFRAGMAAGAGDDNKITWTHTAVFDLGVDIRDRFDGAPTFGGAGDEIFIPDQNGTRFLVMFLEKRGQAKLAYLKRSWPGWPTNNI